MNNLRYIIRDGEKVLQMYIDVGGPYPNYRWQDVPTVTEEHE
jgi:hypothetical protein